MDKCVNVLSDYAAKYLYFSVKYSYNENQRDALFLKFIS